VNIRKMTLDDIPLLNLSEDWMRGRYRMYLAAETGPSWVMEDNGGLLCAFGAAFLWSGVCEVYFNLIEKRHIISQLRTVKRFLDEQGKKYNVRRFHATVKCDFDIGKKFIEFLGFQCEGKLRKYNPDGSDAYLYSRIV